MPERAAMPVTTPRVDGTCQPQPGVDAHHSLWLNTDAVDDDRIHWEEGAAYAQIFVERKIWAARAHDISDDHVCAICLDPIEFLSSEDQVPRPAAP